MKKTAPTNYLVPTYSENALAIYSRLYYSKNETTPFDVHERVSSAISTTPQEKEIFKEMLDNQRFRPNTPCMVNAKTEKSDKTYDNNLAACFVVGLDDSMDSIIELWTICAKVYAGAGGVGIPLSNLREKGAAISTGGVASGPISYLKVVQAISDSVKSGGKSRRAANLTSFKISHPDILEYIESKTHNELSAVNISVLIPDEIMDRISNGISETDELSLVSPANPNTVHSTVPLKLVWDKIINQAWRSGDPGVLFYDEANRRHAFPSKGEILATNPCLPSWAPIKTKTGYTKLSNVKNNINMNGNNHECSDVIRTKVDDSVYAIKLESGLTIYANTNHKISTDCGDIMVGSLNVGTHKVRMDYTRPTEMLENISDPANHTYQMIGYLMARSDEMLFNEPINNNIMFGHVALNFQLGAMTYFIQKFGNIINGELVLIAPDRQNTLQVVQILLQYFGVYSEFIFDELHISETGLLCALMTNTAAEIEDYYYSVLHDTQYDIVDRNVHDLKELQNIEHIEFFMIDDVFDISVPNENHFVTNGAIVHNCGEVTLPNFSMCNLGSLNLMSYVTVNGTFDYAAFSSDVHSANTFLDNVIDKTSYPDDKFRDRMLSERPVGLGIMGFSNVLYVLGLKYGSPESLQLFGDICRILTVSSIENSINRAKTHGPIDIPEEDLDHFIDRLIYFGATTEMIEKFKKYGIRNSTWTSIAPTGSISISADTSYAFEPEMALIWSKTLVDDGRVLYFINKYFAQACEMHGIKLTDELKSKISANNGSCHGIDEIPLHMQNVFVVAHDVSWESKLKMQAAGQRYISLAISSTCNLPKEATTEDVANAYVTAWKLKLKGITVYRDGSLFDQPVNFGAKEETPADKSESTNDLAISKEIKRPMVRIGKTVEVKTPHGKLYLTGNFNNDGTLFEVFLNLGKQGHISNILLDALSRVISKSLQHGVPINSLIHTMKDCGGLSFFIKLDDDDSKSDQAQSIVDAIAMILERHFTTSNVTPTFELTTTPNIDEKCEKCPNCGEYTLRHTSGCRGGSCANCGYSACQ